MLLLKSLLSCSILDRVERDYYPRKRERKRGAFGWTLHSERDVRTKNPERDGLKKEGRDKEGRREKKYGEKRRREDTATGVGDRDI